MMTMNRSEILRISRKSSQHKGAHLGVRRKWLLFLFLVLCSVMFMIMTSIDFHEDQSIFQYKRGLQHLPTCLNKSNCALPRSCSFEFRNILLVVAFNFPYYRNIPILDKMYRSIFPSIVYCGAKRLRGSLNFIKVRVNSGYQAYECLGVAIRKYPHFEGYLFLSDDVLLNWWYLVGLDQQRIWIGESTISRRIFGANLKSGKIPDRWYWWTEGNLIGRCRSAVKEIERKQSIIFSKQGKIEKNRTSSTNLFYRNSRGIKLCTYNRADIFYIPGRLKYVYSNLSRVFYRRKVFLEAAFGTMMYYLDEKDKFIDIEGTFIPHKSGEGMDISDGEIVWQHYNTSHGFLHPVKFTYSIHTIILEKLIYDFSRQKEAVVTAEMKAKGKLRC